MQLGVNININDTFLLPGSCFVSDSLSVDSMKSGKICIWKKYLLFLMGAFRCDEKEKKETSTTGDNKNKSSATMNEMKMLWVLVSHDSILSGDLLLF